MDIIAILTVIGFTGYNAFKKQIIQPLEEVNSQIQSMTVVK